MRTSTSGWAKKLRGGAKTPSLLTQKFSNWREEYSVVQTHWKWEGKQIWSSEKILFLSWYVICRRDGNMIMQIITWQKKTSDAAHVVGVTSWHKKFVSEVIGRWSEIIWIWTIFIWNRDALRHHIPTSNGRQNKHLNVYQKKVVSLHSFSLSLSLSIISPHILSLTLYLSFFLT